MRPHRCSHKSDCFGCRVKTVTFAPSAMPTRRGGQRAAEINAADRKLEKDLVAYKSMYRNGLNPPTPEGAHDLMMRSEEKFEVEAFGAMDPLLRKEYKARLEDVALLPNTGAVPEPIVREE